MSGWLRVLSARLLWLPLSAWHTLRWWPKYDGWLMRKDNMEKLTAVLFGSGVILLIAGLILAGLVSEVYAVLVLVGLVLLVSSVIHIMLVMLVDTVYDYYDKRYRSKVTGALTYAEPNTVPLARKDREEWFLLPLPLAWKTRIAKAGIPARDALKTSTLRYSDDDLAIYGALQVDMFTFNS